MKALGVKEIYYVGSEERKSGMIRNVVFDIGNVLAGFIWQDFFRSFGFSEEVYERLADATVRSGLWNELDRGKLSDEELLEGFVRNDPSIEKEIRKVFQNTKGIILRYEYAVPWIRELKERGYGVYIISNFSRKAHRECMEALDFLEEVDGGILSYQEQLIKPDPEIYRLLCSRYELDAKESVFIDDLERNVAAAIKEGMEGIVFHTLTQAKEELERLLTGTFVVQPDENP